MQGGADRPDAAARRVVPSFLQSGFSRGAVSRRAPDGPDINLSVGDLAVLDSCGKLPTPPGPRILVGRARPGVALMRFRLGGPAPGGSGRLACAPGRGASLPPAQQGARPAQTLRPRRDALTGQPVCVGHAAVESSPPGGWGASGAGGFRLQELLGRWTFHVPCLATFPPSGATVGASPRTGQR